jgi:predicted DNA-binding transcriptional regulator AlpA
MGADSKQTTKQRRRPVAQPAAQNVLIDWQPQTNPASTFLSKKEVLRRITVTGPTLWNWCRTGKFPMPRCIGSRTVWLESEVLAWMNSRPTPNYKNAEGA